MTFQWTANYFLTTDNGKSAVKDQTAEVQL